MIQRPADGAGKPGAPKKPDGAGRPPDTRTPIPSDMAKAPRADAKIGTSESLILRDAQRYLYGSLGDAWPQKHVTHKYHVPKEVAPYLDGNTLIKGDRLSGSR
jgi:hypothetical protein